MEKELNELLEKNINADNENIIYVSKKKGILDSYFNNINEAIQHIKINIKNNLYNIDEIFVIKVFPGEYSENIELPPNVFLEGYDRNLVFINLNLENSYINLTTNNSITNLTIKYFDNYKSNKSYFIKIDCNDYNQNYSFDKNNKILLKNVNFVLDDIYIRKIFDFNNGIITFDNCDININNYQTINFSDNYYLFNSEIGSKLNLLNVNINLNINSIYYSLIKSILSNINISNCIIKYNLTLLNEIKNNEYFIFNDTFSNIDIYNTTLKNSSLGGKLLNLDEDIILDSYIDYEKLIINDKYVVINNYKSKSLIEQIKGIYYNGFNYILLEKLFNKQRKVIMSYNKFKQDRDILGKGKILFGFKINNSYLYNPNLDLNIIYSANYIIDVFNTYIEESNFKGIINYNLDSKGYLVGSSILNGNGIITNNIYTNNFHGSGKNIANIGLKKINKGYAISKKYNHNLGKNSINLGFNSKSKLASGEYSISYGIDNLCLGKLSNSNGINNISEGFLTTTFGESNISRKDYSFSIGKYNNYLGDNLFTIGNGFNKDNRKNIFEVDEKGNVIADNKITCKKFTDTNLTIEEGNITNVSNIEVEDNIFCDGDITIDGEIKGKNLKNKNYLKQVIDFYSITSNDIIISTLKIDLRNLYIPDTLGGIIGTRISNCSLGNISENVNGIIYKIKIFCIETPDFPELRFIGSKFNSDEIKLGNILENKIDFDKETTISLFHSYNWKKGNNKKNKEFEFNDLDSNFNIYLARRHKQKMELTKKNNIFKKGKFILNIYGVKPF